MEFLMNKTKVVNDFAAESRQNIESMQREINKLNAMLSEERSKNF
jgi:hypothetical protein